jgi:hypothetical protein
MNKMTVEKRYLFINRLRSVSFIMVLFTFYKFNKSVIDIRFVCLDLLNIRSGY